MSNYECILQRGITTTALLLTGVISLAVFGDRVRAQTPSGANNSVPNLNSLSGDRLNQLRPVTPLRQRNFLFDSDGGSQQFFRQRTDRLYFLPQSKSEPILKIDENIKTEEVDQEYLPDNSTQE